jgi:hypothetical protein
LETQIPSSPSMGAATPSTGAGALFALYAALVQGAIAPEFGDHAVFCVPRSESSCRRLEFLQAAFSKPGQQQYGREKSTSPCGVDNRWAFPPGLRRQCGPHGGSRQSREPLARPRNPLAARVYSKNCTRSFPSCIRGSIRFTRSTFPSIAVCLVNGRPGAAGALLGPNMGPDAIRWQEMSSTVCTRPCCDATTRLLCHGLPARFLSVVPGLVLIAGRRYDRDLGLPTHSVQTDPQRDCCVDLPAIWKESGCGGTKTVLHDSPATDQTPRTGRRHRFVGPDCSSPVPPCRLGRADRKARTPSPAPEPYSTMLRSRTS